MSHKKLFYIYKKKKKKEKPEKRAIKIILNVLSIIPRADDSSNSFNLKARFANGTEVLAQGTVD